MPGPRCGKNESIPALAIRLAQESGDPADLRTLTDMVRASEQAGEPVRISDLAINGNDLIGLGFKPGRSLQDILCDLLEVVWDHPEKNTREELIKEALKRQD